MWRVGASLTSLSFDSLKSFGPFTESHARSTLCDATTTAQLVIRTGRERLQPIPLSTSGAEQRPPTHSLACSAHLATEAVMLHSPSILPPTAVTAGQYNYSAPLSSPVFADSCPPHRQTSKPGWRSPSLRTLQQQAPRLLHSPMPACPCSWWERGRPVWRRWAD